MNNILSFYLFWPKFIKYGRSKITIKHKSKPHEVKGDGDKKGLFQGFYMNSSNRAFSSLQGILHQYFSEHQFVYS
jgi:hypothetical protein